MKDLVIDFVPEGTAYLQGMGLLHIGPSPYTETQTHPLVGREVIFNGETRIIKYVERESGVPLSIDLAVLPRHWPATTRPAPIRRGDLVGLFFEEQPDGCRVAGRMHGASSSSSTL